MKYQFGKVFIAVLTLGTVSAFGVYRPGWERPILRAQMMEQDSLGHEVGIGLDKTLTMNRQDGAPQPTSLTFTEEQRVYCVVAPCPPIRHTDQFTITNRRLGSCGSTVYTAVETSNRGRVEGRTLTLVDHATRVCDDYRPYRWEAQLTAGRRDVRQLFGNPKPVASIQ